MSMVVAAGGRPATVAESSTSSAAAKATTSAAAAAATTATLAGQEATKEWNTKNLGQRIAVDAACAATAGGLVAPIVSMIDKAIIENASGKSPLMTSIKSSMSTLLLRPHKYLTSKPFGLILMVYGGTYLCANALDTFKSTSQGKPASTVTHGLPKFMATSSANLSLTMVKDSQFTKMFGTATSRPVPPLTYALFAIRDSMTIFASFNLPPVIAPRLPMGEAAEKFMSRASAAQFLAPAAIQFLSTPCHLYGLDLYNRNGGTPVSERLKKVRVDWLKSSLARMCRIVPAFGFGGIVNNGLRSKFMKTLE